MSKNSKVIVIGLDGATWDLIKPWADEGKLPTFKKLMKEGAWGELEKERRIGLDGRHNEQE